MLYSGFALSWRLVKVLQEFVFLGSDATVIRDGARAKSAAHRSETATLAYGMTFSGGILLAFGTYTFSPTLNGLTLDTSELLVAYRIAGFIVACAGIVLMNGYFFRSQENVKQLLVVKDVGWPLIRFLMVVLALLLGFELLGTLGAILCGTFLLGIGGFIYTLRSTKTGFKLPSRKQMFSFFNHALPSAFTRISIFIRLQIYIFLLSYLVTNAAAPGQFNVMLILSQVAIIPLQGFNKLLPPIAAELYSKNQKKLLREIYSAITRLITILTLPLVTFIGIFGSELLIVFGTEYAVGYLALIILLAGRITGNCVGATGWLLLMTDNQYLRLILDWLLALVNLPFSIFLIQRWGVLGAAIGFSSQRAGQNLLQVFFLWYFEGLFPFDTTYWKPLLAVCFMIGTLILVTLCPINTGFKLLSGALLGTLVYGFVLFRLGFEKLDRAVALGLYEEQDSLPALYFEFFTKCNLSSPLPLGSVEIVLKGPLNVKGRESLLF